MLMKPIALLFVFSFAFLLGSAQAVSQLPSGKYETRLKAAQKSWEKGDIILLDDTHYKLSSGGDVGEYKFSVAAQRIFFTSGPLKSLFTKVNLVNNKPVIIIPAEQNGDLGITAEIWASKQ